MRTAKEIDFIGSLPRNTTSTEELLAELDAAAVDAPYIWTMKALDIAVSWTVVDLPVYV